MVDSTKVLCPLFDEIEILIPGDKQLKHCPISGQNVKKMTETNKNDFNEQLIKHEWMHKCVTSIHLLHDGFEST